ncbi:FkbM family methyltransferase [Thermodesulfobacteriota bacterium]
MYHEMLFKTIIHDNSVVFDVGGHRGFYARIFSEVVKAKGKVFSFEPHPEKYSDLKTVAESCALKNILPYSLAINDTIGTTVLYYGEESHADGASTICPELATQERLGAEIRQITVKTTTLDSFCQEIHTLPDFVKIDVEGAESKVITGMANLIHQNKPTILFECGVTTEIPQQFAVLRDLGYVLLVVDITRFLGETCSWDNTVDSSNKKLRSKVYSFSDDILISAEPALTNVLCVHRDQIAKLIPNRLVMPLEVALLHLGPPKPSLRSQVIKYLPDRLVRVLRSLKSQWRNR